MDIYDTVGSVLTGETDFREIRKQLEKEAIKAFCAPPILSDRRSIVSKYDERNTTVAASTKSSVLVLSHQLDTAIEGLGGKAINSALKTHSADFDEI